jgi:hypothetical protein
VSLKRVSTLAIAYACASMTAGLVLALPLLSWALGIDSSLPALIDTAGIVVFYVAVTAAMALLPALVAIAIGEIKGITARRWYAAIGGGIGVIVLLPLVLIGAPPGGLVEQLRPLVFFGPLVIIAGACAGLMFWLIAVRLPASRVLWPRTSAGIP